MSQEIDFLAVMPKLLSLSLVESATTHASQTAEYCVTTILESLLEPLLSEEEWQTTRQQAARKIYQVWWEESEERTEEKGLEIVRLGLLAGEQEIAVSIGSRIANRWVNSSRYVEVVQLCEPLLQKFVDYRILGTIANAEKVLGRVEDAVAHCQQALDLCPEEDLTEKAATLSNMAWFIAQQGDIQEAIALWQQDLEISERIGDVGGKAVTLRNLAYWAGKTGDKARQLDLNLQAASALAQVRAYGDLVRVLNNLGVADESNGLVYLAQAIWLTLRIQAPLADTIHLIRALYDAVPQGDELQALLGRTALFFCQRRGEGHPQLEELQDLSVRIISSAAGAQGVETQGAFDTWFVQQRLNDPEYYLTRLIQRLEEIVGDGWLFDRSQVS